MNQLMNWLSMGGYSLYIWPAYGLVIFVLLMNVWAVKKQKTRTLQTLQQWFKR